MNHDIESWLAIALADADPLRRAQLQDEILDHVAEAKPDTARCHYGEALDLPPAGWNNLFFQFVSVASPPKRTEVVDFAALPQAKTGVARDDFQPRRDDA